MHSQMRSQTHSDTDVELDGCRARCKATDGALIESCVTMQSLDIRQPAERSSRVVASAILIDCPAATTAAVTIPSSYFALAVSTDCSASTVLNLYRCWIYFTAKIC